MPLEERLDEVMALFGYLQGHVDDHIENPRDDLTSYLIALDKDPASLLGALEPRLPQDLTAIIDKAMAWNALDRYPTAFELAEDLRRFQTGHLVTARRYSPLGRAFRQLRRWGWMGALALATLSGIAVGRLLWR